MQTGHLAVPGGLHIGALRAFSGSLILPGGRWRWQITDRQRGSAASTPGDEAQPPMVVAMIEDQTIGLARCGAQAATHDLHEQHLGFGRPCEDDAADIPINAGASACRLKPPPSPHQSGNPLDGSAAHPHFAGFFRPHAHLPVKASI